jgi:micrococcal nuclease
MVCVMRRNARRVARTPLRAESVKSRRLRPVELVSISAAAIFFAACGEMNSGAPDAGFFARDASATTPIGIDAGLEPSTGILVDEVFDGDTIRVRAAASILAPDGRPLSGQHIRLLGVDAPEIAHGTEPADCWGPEAAEYARELVGGTFIRLDYDEANGVRDQFGRLLAYVILEDGRVMNETLVRDGQARSFRRFQHRELIRYNALETEAKDERLGLWTCPGRN